VGLLDITHAMPRRATAGMRVGKDSGTWDTRSRISPRAGYEGHSRSRLRTGRAQDARGPADPELQRARHAPAGDDVRDRAYDHLGDYDIRISEWDVVDLHGGRLARGALRAR